MVSFIVLGACSYSSNNRIEQSAANETKEALDWRTMHPDSVLCIDMSGAGLTKVPDLSLFTNLESIDLSYNKIDLSDFETFERLTGYDINNYQYGPDGLKSINLSHNISTDSIVNFTFFLNYFERLEYLDLSHNNIGRFFLAGSKLKYLDLSHNALDNIVIDASIDTLDLSHNLKLTGKQKIASDQIVYLKTEGLDTANFELIDRRMMQAIMKEQEENDYSELEHPDSINLKKHRREILSHLMELNYPRAMLPDSILEELVYLENGYHWQIDEGTVYASPDSLFKVYQFFGETVGAYSNPFWESFLHFGSGKNEQIKEVDITEIKGVYVLPDKKCLIIQERYGRGASVYGDTRLIAELISFKDTSLIYHPIKTPNYCWLYDDGRSSRIELVNGSDTGRNLLEMTYDSNTQEINYRFSNNVLYLCQTDSSYTYSGSYKYLNGTFVHQHENRTGIKGSYESDF